jgi:cellulose synthase/poly-beta-1,6-N-acetylglucosamine synthase-like glycosyltransferase
MTAQLSPSSVPRERSALPDHRSDHRQGDHIVRRAQQHPAGSRFDSGSDRGEIANDGVAPPESSLLPDPSLGTGLPFPWWMPQLAAFGVALGILAYVAMRDTQGGWFEAHSFGWWVVTTALHLPLLLILLFLAVGLVERVGFYWRGRAPEPPGHLPEIYPTVCVQLPMFNEHAVAQRVIAAAADITWPVDRLSVQVLDDSTDGDTRALIDDVCADIQAASGVRCHVLRRVARDGYKAGALEEGRKETDAEFLAIFDADFVPPQDFLLKAMPHFYLSNGEPDHGLALVQAQWGHLNHDESALTLAQSLWVDDHHTLQMSWRSAMWRFVNFTGTAGVLRASAIDAAGGWRAASLVEDCELSFRHLFAGYRTKFVKEIVAPAELPATYTAYKAQQKRWTQGWVQLARLHLSTLLFRYQCSWPKRLHLLYHMGISWQWPAWAAWITLLPLLIHTGHWFGSFGITLGLMLYLMPSALWITVVTITASIETKHTYPGATTLRSFLARLGRVVPHLIIHTGMLPHQVSAFCEGLFGSLHSEFERTPKAASVTTTTNMSESRVHILEAIGSSRAATLEMRQTPKAPEADHPKVHWPYLLTEAGFIFYQVAWMVMFARNGIWWCALGAACVAVCLLALFFPSLAAVIRHGSDPSGNSPRRRDGDQGGTPSSA